MKEAQDKPARDEDREIGEADETASAETGPIGGGGSPSGPDSSASRSSATRQKRRRSRKGELDDPASRDAAPDVSSDSRSAPPPDDRAVPPIVSDALGALREYVLQLRTGRSLPLAVALEDYTDRAERVAKGRLTAAHARPPEMLTPRLVADALATGRWRARVESIRNFLIFLPVLFTWLEIAAAAEAYGRLDAPEDPFISLWQDGFGAAGDWFTLTLSLTALVVGTLLWFLVLATLVLSVLRGRHASRHAEIEMAFASTMTLVSRAADTIDAETPQQQIAEFQRAGRELSDNLASLAVELRLQGAPLAQSLTTANTVMQSLSEVATRQSEELSKVTASLEQVAQIGGQLGAAQVGIERAAEALDKIESALGPAASRIATDVDSVTEVARQLERAAANIAATLGQVVPGIDAIEHAGSQFNAIADRILHDPRLS